MIKVKKIKTGVIEENCYLVYDADTRRTAIIDPGGDASQIVDAISSQGLLPEILINTHGHYDHIMADDVIRKTYKIPLAVHKDEVDMLVDPKKNGSALYGPYISVKDPEVFLEDNQEVKLSFVTFKVFSTPGHSKGSICLLFESYLFTGDTLFAGTVGRTDLWSGDTDDMLESIKKLKKLDPSITVCPGHGSMTTISNEFIHNPFLITMT